MIRVAVGGASGYTGSECVRLLHAHPQVEIVSLFAQKNAGASTAPYFYGQAGIPTTFDTFDPACSYDIDCLFLALPHTAVHPMMDEMAKHPYKIIDLSADFRLSSAEMYHTYYDQSHQAPSFLKHVVYGCVEYYKHDIAQAKWVANPGCNALAVILALKPLTEAGLVKQAVVDAKCGVTGAGKTVSEALLFSEVNEQCTAYKTHAHRHVAEFNEQCPCPLIFSPHLVPMQRGILASCYIETTASQTVASLMTHYETAYSQAPFIRVQQNKQASTRHVERSNMCELTVACVTPTHAIVFSAIDNLLKGAAGNAIEVFNVMFSLEQPTGLPQLPERV